MAQDADLFPTVPMDFDEKHNKMAIFAANSIDGDIMLIDPATVSFARQHALQFLLPHINCTEAILQVVRVC